MIELAFTAKLMKPPERLQTKSGDGFTVLALLVDGLAKIDGEAQAAWVRTTCFAEVAETAATLDKGATVFAKGTPTMDRWADKAGTEKAGLSLIASEIVRLGTSARKSQPHRQPKDIPHGLPQGPKSYEAVRVKPDWQSPIQPDQRWNECGDRIDDIM